MFLFLSAISETKNIVKQFPHIYDCQFEANFPTVVVKRDRLRWGGGALGGTEFRMQ